MKNIVVAFFVVILLSACQDKITKPDPFVEESTMEDILYDVALLYGAQNTNSFVIDTVQPVQMSDIFKKYEIDSLAFVKNSRYYIALKERILRYANTCDAAIAKEQTRLDTIVEKPEIKKLDKISESVTDPAIDSLTKETLTQPVTSTNTGKETDSNLEVKKKEK